MVISETCGKPVSKQPGWKPVPVLTVLDITIVYQNLDRVGNPSADVIDERLVLVLQATPGARCEHALGRGLGEDLHRDGEGLIIQSILEACLVVDQVDLPERPQKTGLIYVSNVRDGYRACPSDGGKVSNPSEERLHMVRNAESQGVIDGVRHPVFNL